MKKPELPKNTDSYYYQLEPVYDHYKKVRVIDRCECCDHKTGEHLEKRGVKVVGWKVKKYKKDWLWTMGRFYEKQIEDFILSPNPLVESFMKDGQDDW